MIFSLLLDEVKQSCISGADTDSGKILLFESLILAQDERWRRALGMQVERLYKELALCKVAADG